MSDAVVWVLYGVALCAGVVIGAVGMWLHLTEREAPPALTCPRCVP